ncbi:hypothetical protein HNY73_010505 [Argiope bruennichi]|uniref:Uncharacterized protein n=1 Tax=Argiope bruennichi TaxID=94029 RepID=A0A8T0F7C5_ARGBR|nr:hypothetical protein HNY73_010505 [Argiope bruennichi]
MDLTDESFEIDLEEISARRHGFHHFVICLRIFDFVSAFAFILYIIRIIFLLFRKKTKRIANAKDSEIICGAISANNEEKSPDAKDSEIICGAISANNEEKSPDAKDSEIICGDWTAIMHLFIHVGENGIEINMIKYLGNYEGEQECKDAIVNFFVFIIVAVLIMQLILLGHLLIDLFEREEEQDEEMPFLEILSSVLIIICLIIGYYYMTI